MEFAAIRAYAVAKMETNEGIMAKSATTVTATSADSATKKTAARSTKAATTPAATTTAGSRSRKAATAPSAEAAIAAAAQVDPVLVTEAKIAPAGTEMKKRELVDRIATHGGLKKKQVKPVVDAMLAVLGEMLAEGREMNLPPMGKMKVNRQKSVAGGQVILIRLRTGTGAATAAGTAEIAAETAAETLAEPAE